MAATTNNKIVTVDTLSHYDELIRANLGKIEISNTAPTDPNVKIWIDTSAERVDIGFTEDADINKLF